MMRRSPFDADHHIFTDRAQDDMDEHGTNYVHYNKDNSVKLNTVVKRCLSFANYLISIVLCIVYTYTLIQLSSSAFFVSVIRFIPIPTKQIGLFDLLSYYETDICCPIIVVIIFFSIAESIHLSWKRYLVPASALFYITLSLRL